MLITMIANLILIHALSIIWSTGHVTSVEPPVKVSREVYASIVQQLKIRPPAMGGVDAAKARYDVYYRTRTVENPEVCEWGSLVSELNNDPTYNICVGVVVSLKDQNDFRQLALTSPSQTSASSNYANYECRKIRIANMAYVGSDSVEQKVLVCPRITVNNFTTGEPVTFEKFLIADGDREQNSMFIFGFSNTFEEMNLKFYLDGVMRIDIMKIYGRNRQTFQKLVNHLPRKMKLNDLCNCPITEKQNVCKYAALMMFHDEDGQVKFGGDFEFDATHVDRSGFVPYRCFKRYTARLYSTTDNVAVHVGSAEPADHIYCPGQLVKLGETVVAQDGFFYTIVNDTNEALVILKESVYPILRGEHKVEEKIVIPFPKRR